MEPTSGDGEVVTVQIRLYDGTRKAEAELPLQTTVAEVVEMARMRWHLDEERDFRLVHTLRTRESGGGWSEADIELADEVTLGAAGVGAGTLLTLYPLLVAGAGAFAAVHQRRLEREHLALRALEEQHGEVVRIESAEGTPPVRYRFRLACQGVVGIAADGRAVLGSEHRLEIAVPDDYPSAGSRPRARFLTPLQHLHVYTGGAVCLGAVAGPDEPLDALVVRLVRLVQCDPELFSFDSPANPALLGWTKKNLASMPFGRKLLPKRPAAAIAWRDC